MRIIGKGCVSRGALDPSDRVQAPFKVKPKRKARGKRVTLRFTASGSGAETARATATLKVKRR